MTLQEAKENIGNQVVYTNFIGSYEYGIITSVNDKFIFVRYGEDVGSQATRPEDLKLAFN